MTLFNNARRTPALAIFAMAILLISLSGCQKELSFENAGPPVVQAKGSLQDATGNCIPATVHGTWYNGVTPGDTNYVEITVNVTRAGYYHIATGTVNGVTLADSGSFATTGPQTVRLKPRGTFVNVGTSYFTDSFDTTTCLFNIDVQDSTGTGLGGSNGGGGNNGGGTVTVALNKWTFTANNHKYEGKIISGSVVTYVGTQMVLNGQMQSNSTDTVFQLTVQLPGTSVTPGTYPTSTVGTNFIFMKVSGDVIYTALALSTQTVNIVIKSYDASTKTVEGTFAGDSYDFSGSTVPVTNGAFKAKLQ